MKVLKIIEAKNTLEILLEKPGMNTQTALMILANYNDVCKVYDTLAPKQNEIIKFHSLVSSNGEKSLTPEGKQKMMELMMKDVNFTCDHLIPVRSLDPAGLSPHELSTILFLLDLGGKNNE